VYGGEGLARSDGQVLLAPFVLPGEHVRAAAYPVKPGLLRATEIEILIPVSGRVTPPCEYFGVCGGCQYQHAAYPLQLQQKEAILRETLQRIAGYAYESAIHAISGEPWQYRNRIQLHFDKPRAGFRRASSHELCAIDHCHVASPTLVDAIQKLVKAVKAPQWPAFLSSVDLFTNERELQLTIADTSRPVAARFFEWCATLLPKLAPGAIQYQAAGFDFRISRGSFFQVNRFLIDALVAEAVRDSEGGYGVDLFAGVGLFALPLARSFTRVQAVERSGPAVRDLEWNASQQAPNVAVLKQDANEFLASLTETPDLVIADPPRAGLGPKATAELLRILPTQLVLVSCDPATLSRDLKHLLSAYAVEKLTLIDLFPQTFHFETLVHLRRK
jgi:23S rRNA (uracil1939-C5)-methyltransferase